METCMAAKGGGLIEGSRWVVLAVTLVNRAFLAAVLLGFVLSFVFARQYAAILLAANPAVDVRAEATGLRLLMLLGAAMSLGTEVLLRALARIVQSVKAGDPFVAVNAGRLQTIGWALLGLQLTDVAGALLAKWCPSLGNAAPDSSFSPSGWIAVLMVFVLSRVFTAGAAMRDDLEGTV